MVTSMAAFRGTQPAIRKAHMKRSILIIKVGYCETFVNEQGFTPSLGDVFRHTVILHHFADCRVTWLTSAAAVPLLAGNPFIAELLTVEGGGERALAGRAFDEVVCFEKAPSLCDLARSVHAPVHRGFGWNGHATRAEPGSEPVLRIAGGGRSQRPIQSFLFRMVGGTWRGEDYVMPHRDTETTTRFDVGLNFRVGKKWPTKQWPAGHWQALSDLCELHGLTVTWQRGASDLSDYMDWLGSCRTIVTCDSLGMHLGLAMHRHVVVLFGSTPSEQIHLYGRGAIIKSHGACSQAPCFKPQCAHATSGGCMEAIRPVTVFQQVLADVATGTSEDDQPWIARCA
jgi:heptosyltransferase II